MREIVMDQKKFAGILDRLMRKYKMMKEKVKKKIPFRDFFTQRKDLSGIQLFKSIDEKAKQAIIKSGGGASPYYMVWFGPDAKVEKVGNGKVVMLNSSRVLLRVVSHPKIQGGQVLSYMGKGGEKGVVEKIRDFFSSGKGTITDKIQGILGMDALARRAIVKDGGEIQEHAVARFKNAELVTLAGSKMIHFPKTGELLALSKGLGENSAVTYAGSSKELKEEVEEEAATEEKAPETAPETTTEPTQEEAPAEAA